MAADQKNQVKEATYVKYELILKKHILPEMGGYYPDGLTEMHIGRFTGWLLREAGLCPKTVRDILAVLHSVLIYTKKTDDVLFSGGSKLSQGFPEGDAGAFLRGTEKTDGISSGKYG